MLRRRRLFVFVCICGALAAVVGAGLGFVVRGAHAGPRPGSPNIGGGGPNILSCYRWAAYAGPNQGSGNNTLNAVAAVPNSVQVWAVGKAQDTTTGHWLTLTEHFDGTRWSIVPSPNAPSADNYLLGVAATSANTAWAIGYAGAGTSGTQTLIERWNGTNWSIVASPSVPQALNILYGVTAVSANDVWAVGTYFDNSTIKYHTLAEHWNGSAWSMVASPNGNIPGPKSTMPGNNTLTSVTAISANDIWAVGLDSDTTLAEHWNGSSWGIVPTPNGSSGIGSLQSVAALSSTSVMAVGFTGSAGGNVTLAEQWNGSSWSIVPTPNPTTTNNNVLNAISAVPGTQTYIAAGTATAQGGIATRGITRSSSHGGPYSSITTSETLVESWNGASWSLFSTQNLSSYVNSLNSITAASVSTTWAVGKYQAATADNTLIMRAVPNGMEIACTR